MKTNKVDVYIKQRTLKRRLHTIGGAFIATGVVAVLLYAFHLAIIAVFAGGYEL
jgi:hypothetical protein